MANLEVDMWEKTSAVRICGLSLVIPQREVREAFRVNEGLGEIGILGTCTLLTVQNELESGQGV